MTLVEIEISISQQSQGFSSVLGSEGRFLLHCADWEHVLLCIIYSPSQRLGFFFFSLAAQVQQHVFAFNRLDVLCVSLLWAGSSFFIYITIMSLFNPLNGSSGLLWAFSCSAVCTRSAKYFWNITKIFNLMLFYILQTGYFIKYQIKQRDWTLQENIIN